MKNLNHSMQLQLVTRYGKIVPNYARKKYFHGVDVIGDATGRPQKCPSIFICKSEMNFFRDNTMEHNTTEDNTMEHNTTEHNTTTDTTQQRSTTQQRTQHNSVAQHNGAQHNGAQHNTTEHSTAQWSTAQQSKIHCQYVCSGGFVNHGTRDLL